LEYQAHLRVQEDPKIACLACDPLASRLVDPDKGIMVRKHLVQALEDRTVELRAVLDPYVSRIVRIVEEQLGEGRRLLRARL
jgi:hypothetical protein